MSRSWGESATGFSGGPALLILHPGARRHRQLEALLQLYRQHYDLQVEESRYAGHTLEICRRQLGNFSGVVLTAGGDGTLHEAINAWGELGFPDGPLFAPLPLGTGNDFLFSAHPDLRQRNTFLQRPLTHRCQADLGRVTYQTEEGPRSRYFCVGATCGFSALVTYRRAVLARSIPGTLSYLLALFLSLGSWRNTSVRVEGPEQTFQESVFFNFNCANVKHYGGGMVSAPRADGFAGRLDAVSMNLRLSEVRPGPQRAAISPSGAADRHPPAGLPGAGRRRAAGTDAHDRGVPARRAAGPTAGNLIPRTPTPRGRTRTS
jgi:diacylglycerol kinase family enzyme